MFTQRIAMIADQRRAGSAPGQWGCSTPLHGRLFAACLLVCLVLTPAGASAEEGRAAAEKMLTASTVGSVQEMGDLVVLILDDGTTLKARSNSFRVTGVRPDSDEEAEQPSPAQLQDPAFREQRRKMRAAERAARTLPVTDLQPGQAVVVMARVDEAGEVSKVVVRMFESLQEAQQVLQERLQRQEERRQRGEKQQEETSEPVVDGSETSG